MCSMLYIVSNSGDLFALQAFFSPNPPKDSKTLENNKYPQRAVGVSPGCSVQEQDFPRSQSL